MFCHFMVCLVKLWGIPVALFTVDCGSTVIRYRDAGYAAKELIHMDMGSDPGLGPFVYKSLHVSILAVRQYTDKDPCISDLTGIRVDDMGRVTSPVDFYLFSRFSGNVHGGAPFLLILLDMEAKLRIHKRIIT